MEVATTILLSVMFALILAVYGFLHNQNIKLDSRIETGQKELAKELRIVREELDSRIEAVQKELGILSQQQVFPSGTTFLLALATQAKFWEKLFIQRGDKVAISSTIATEYIGESDKKIIVDSGTTVDQIPHMLAQRSSQRKTKLEVFTNNILAAVSVVPPPKGFDCFLLSGRIDPIFGATYNIPDIEGPLREIEADKIVLATTSISFETGPMVAGQDLFNHRFKNELVRKALDDPQKTTLIIAVDWTKLHRLGDIKNGQVPVLDQERWQIVRAQSSFVLVTTKPEASLTSADAARAREVIDAFETNMKTNHGMTIHVIS